MLEYKSGHIDQPEPLDDALVKLRQRLSEVKALHIGTETDLTRQRRRMLEREAATLEDRIEQLEGKVKALIDQIDAALLTSDVLHLPTPSEVAAVEEMSKAADRIRTRRP